MNKYLPATLDILMPGMPHSRIWQSRLVGGYGDQRARAIVSRAQAYYVEFSARQKAERDRSNRSVLKTRLLPGLSIYKALLEESADRQKVLQQVDALFRAAFFTKRMQGIRILNLFPDPFPIVIPVLKRMTRKEYLPGSQEIIRDDADGYALNVYRCFILDTLAQYHAEELTACFCNTDDWLAELLPKIGWSRTQTLGRGGECCDFCWHRVRTTPGCGRW
jgi:hypothetical protein